MMADGHFPGQWQTPLCIHGPVRATLPGGRAGRPQVGQVLGFQVPAGSSQAMTSPLPGPGLGTARLWYCWSVSRLPAWQPLQPALAVERATPPLFRVG